MKMKIKVIMHLHDREISNEDLYGPELSVEKDGIIVPIRYRHSETFTEREIYTIMQDRTQATYREVLRQKTLRDRARIEKTLKDIEDGRIKHPLDALKNICRRYDGIITKKPDRRMQNEMERTAERIMNVLSLLIRALEENTVEVRPRQG